jgi:hypothetical protein
MITGHSSVALESMSGECLVGSVRTIDTKGPRFRISLAVRLSRLFRVLAVISKTRLPSTFLFFAITQSDTQKVVSIDGSRLPPSE